VEDEVKWKGALVLHFDILENFATLKFTMFKWHEIHLNVFLKLQIFPLLPNQRHDHGMEKHVVQSTLSK